MMADVHSVEERRVAKKLGAEFYRWRQSVANPIGRDGQENYIPWVPIWGMLFIPTDTPPWVFEQRRRDLVPEGFKFSLENRHPLCCGGSHS